MSTHPPPSFRNASAIVRDIISMGEVDFPDQFNGTGAPGDTLEFLLNVNRNNYDSPDYLDWEIKFHGGTSLLTLFHKEPKPRGGLKPFVERYGWPGANGQISFRHTISGSSPRGFVITNVDNRIIITNVADPALQVYYEHNTILNAFGAKLRRLIVVNGIVNPRERTVRYNNATAYWDLDLIRICEAIQNGTIYIDFDCRTTRGRGTALRNHGTKFRIDVENIGVIYENSRVIV